MQSKRLGRSPIVVSKICMGTMTFGNQTDEATAFRILDKAFDAGVNFFDTAENYPVPPDEKWAGRTEEFVGRWMKTKRRDAIIMATKVCGPSHGWIKGAQRAGMTALDRHNIVRAIEASLKRLDTDYIDLYQTHWPDHGARYEEALLESFQSAGLIRTDAPWPRRRGDRATISEVVRSTAHGPCARCAVRRFPCPQRSGARIRMTARGRVRSASPRTAPGRLLPPADRNSSRPSALRWQRRC
jgi:hypothetical protein